MKNNFLSWFRDIIIILITFAAGVSLGIGLDLYRTQRETVKALELVNAEYCLTDSITDDCLKVNFQKHKIRFSHIVLAQAKLESNNYKSKLLFTSNNLFGMKVAATRFTFATNSYDYGNYARYETIEDCILDYRSWQIQNANFIVTEEAYFDLLHKYYAEDPNYVTKLKQLIK